MNSKTTRQYRQPQHVGHNSTVIQLAGAKATGAETSVTEPEVQSGHQVIVLFKSVPKMNTESRIK